MDPGLMILLPGRGGQGRPGHGALHQAGIHRMELPFKIVSTDFDGTVHTDAQQPPIPVVFQEKISQLQDQGVKWVVNTGRDFGSLMGALDSARLVITPDYLVVVEREIHVRERHGFNACLDWNAHCRDEQAALFSRIEPRLADIIDWIHDHFTATVYADDYSPFCLAAATNDDADAILRHVADTFRHLPELTIVRNDIYARFSHVAYNKGTAMSEVARLNGIPRDLVLAAGDHFNDLPMLSLEHARFLVAPSNAIPEVKALVQRQGGFISRDPGGYGVVQGLDFYLNHLGPKT
jgi:HAD superfamily hydrolase (TIGR01484 family)